MARAAAAEPLRRLRGPSRSGALPPLRCAARALVARVLVQPRVRTTPQPADAVTFTQAVRQVRFRVRLGGTIERALFRVAPAHAAKPLSPGVPDAQTLRRVPTRCRRPGTQRGTGGVRRHSRSGLAESRTPRRRRERFVR